MATIRKQIMDEVQKLFTEYIGSFTYTYSEVNVDTNIGVNIDAPRSLYIVYLQIDIDATPPDTNIDNDYLTDFSATGWTFTRPVNDETKKILYLIAYDEDFNQNPDDMLAVTGFTELQTNQEVSLYYANTGTSVPETEVVEKTPTPTIPTAWATYDADNSNDIFTVQTQTNNTYFTTISNRFANPLHINVNSMPFVSIGYGNTQKQNPFIAQDLRNIFSLFVYITHTDNRPNDIFLLDVSDEIHEIVESIVEELDHFSFIDTSSRTEMEIANNVAYPDIQIRTYDGCELGSVKTVAGKFTDREFMEFRLDFTLEKTRDPDIFDPDEDDMMT